MFVNMFVHIMNVVVHVCVRLHVCLHVYVCVHMCV